MSDCPEAGAIPDDGGTTFRAWAPRVTELAVRLHAAADEPIATHPLRPIGGGWFEARLAGAGPGTLYTFVLDGRERPDPYARFLPFGVHGPAEVIARARAAPLWNAPPLHRHVVYELHVGAFTPEGTYAAAAERLGELADLGVTALELMPVSSFPGRRGWGYDGVAHFAPFAPYGRPEALRLLVERAHALGLAVLLDVVYNHFGPRGNYLGEYAREYFTSAHGNPWGSAPDFRVAAMRRYVVDNARMWFDEYGFDGLRLDAVHTIRDDSPVHVLRDLRDLAASYRPTRILVGEDDRNDPSVVTELGLDAVWADDFHHQMRVLLTGERDGYYAAYEPRLKDLARVIERGWLFEGQRYGPWDAPRGKPAGELAPERFVYCVENHDQVGNRAFGTRLDIDAGADALRAATAVLLFLPTTPLVFMGQEWACSSPFLFFTDHDPEYGPLVSQGRRAEFGRFAAFADESARERIPDPQSPETFERSKLRWQERDVEPHRSFLESVRAMLRLRRDDPVLRAPGRRSSLCAREQDGVLVVER
ncbi:MAG TPA: malto-oligosyltrehalose trehalohydrolase, partial [Polyangiaceae bacterium]|nr:malto-oligosyltrehalose trehalohydrolase [Polyangiaceae bacterium]